MRYQYMPELTPEEFEALKVDIAANGVQVAVIVDEHGNIIDGHHRARAADELGEDYEVETVVGLSDEAKRDMALRLNFKRRQVTPDARRPVVERLYVDEEMTQQQIAELLGVSQGTVARDLDIINVDKNDPRGRPRKQQDAPQDDAPQDEAPPAEDVPDDVRPCEACGGPIEADDWDGYTICRSCDSERAAAEGESGDDSEPEPTTAKPKPLPVMLTLRTHKGDPVEYPKPQSKATFNQSDGEGISWAAWSWNPVTGCLHGCDYCYARAIINRYASANPVGFTPLFHHERLDAPANTTIPAAHADDEAYKRVFVCSMADLYGRWVPDDWIDQVHAAMLDEPRWQYILLTKFPGRYTGLQMPSGAWIGTSVDEQKRVRIAEDAFREIDGGAVKWLSLEPLREPLEFTDLSVFDWVVIGAQTATVQPDGPVPAFAPPFEWVARIVAQAREAGCKVHLKPNLGNGRPGMQLPDEYPGGA